MPPADLGNTLYLVDPPTSMALAHTILTVLLDAPCSGYDISKQFDMGVGCFWNASQQQIYRELAKMERQGWVKFETIPQSGKPDKKIYQATATGREELQRWYAEPSDPTAIREDLLVKVLAGAYLPSGDLIKELHRRRQGHQEKLMHYQAKAAGYHANREPAPMEQYLYLTLRRGIRYEQAWIDWCDEVLAALHQQDTDLNQTNPN
jgi:DNA-binding PadR family transcriptional regulator